MNKNDSTNMLCLFQFVVHIDSRFDCKHHLIGNLINIAKNETKTKLDRSVKTCNS